MASVDIGKCKISTSTLGGSPGRYMVRYAQNSRGFWNPLFVGPDGRAWLVSEHEFGDPHRVNDATKGMGEAGEDRLDEMLDGGEPSSTDRLDAIAADLMAQGA